jgi:hypothetical protein
MRARFGASVLLAFVLAFPGCSGRGDHDRDPGAPMPDVAADPGGTADQGQDLPRQDLPVVSDPGAPVDPGDDLDEAATDPGTPDDVGPTDKIGPPEDDGTEPADDGTVADADAATCQCTVGECCDGCHFRGADHVCRERAGLCDVEERCTGDAAGCPDEGFADFGNPCGGPAESACDLPDACDGYGVCLSNHLDEDTPCDDGLTCNGNDFCDALGACDRHTGDPCDVGTTCVEGRGCLDECQVAEFLGTSTGCQFWSVFLQRAEGVDPGVLHALAVSNPHDTEVTVTVFGAGDQQVATANVGPGTVGTLTLGGDRRLTGPGVSDRAFRVVASRPVGLVQINPRQDEILYHNADASLLLPDGALGTRYRATTWPSWYYYFNSGCGEPTREYRSGFVAIVATEPGTTTVTVTYQAASVAGDGLEAQAAGDTVQYALTRHQVLNLNSAPAEDCADSCLGPDLTGSLIVADRRIAVFGGHPCAALPETNGTCLHMEHQVPPETAWGRDHVAVRTARLGSPKPERFRILAGMDDTEVTLAGGAQDAFTLNAGQVRTVTPEADFVVHAKHPVLVTQFLPTWGYGDDNGWNAMTLLAPVERFRREFVFPVTSFYNLDQVLVVAPPDTEVRLDGSPLDPSLFQEIPETGWRFAILTVDDGLHRIEASNPVGLQVYGHSTYYYTGSNRSYAFTGGW